MSLYDIAVNFFKDYIFKNNFLSSNSIEMFGNNLTIADWLSHTATIISMALVILFFIKLIIYFSKWFGGLFKF